MKSILKFTFNFLRNVSLVIVIILIAFILWLKNDEKFRQDLAFRLDKQEQPDKNTEEIIRQRKVEEIMAQAAIETDDEEETEGLMAFRNDNEINQSPTKIEELSANDANSRKLSLDVQGGKAYIRPSQIMYIQAQENEQKIITVSQNEIITSSGMKNIKQMLEEKSGEEFFYTRSNIFNKNYIQQVYRQSDNRKDKYNYSYWVIFENSEKISLPRESLNLLIQELDKLSI